MTSGTARGTSYMNRLFTAARNFLKRHLNACLEVFSSNRTRAAVAENPLEQIFAETKSQPSKDLVEIDACEQVLGRDAGGGKTTRIVGGALLGIRQYRVSLRDLLEALLRTGLLVAVGMIAKRECAKRVAYRFGVGITPYAQNFVVVAPLIGNNWISYFFSRNSASTTRAPDAPDFASKPAPADVPACGPLREVSA